MKIIVLLLTAAILQVSASTYGQNVTINQRNADLAKVIKALRKQTGFDFVYSNKMLALAKPVNLNLNNVPFEVALEQCFKNQPLTFSITDQIVTIKEKDPTFLERLAERWASIDVSGRVVDAEGKALPGATVKVKATGKGVSTDVKGNFHLKNLEEAAVLVVSYTGYISKEVNASANMGNVVLEVSLSKLDEVQVIAYGTTTQRLSTGNVTTIKADVIEKQPVNNPLLALQGRVPGLFIEQATGFAGTGVKVRIQGQNSFANGNDPLYVIDGIPFTSQLLPGFGNSILGQSGGTTGTQYGNPLNFINPADIESIDVLKDADATAIYGSRAANGAILITTKNGEVGDIKFDANIQNGWGKVGRRLDLMNSKQYVNMRKEAYINDNIDLNAPPYSTDLYKRFLYPDISLWDTTRYTDWQKELIGRTAKYQDAHVSISGGSNKIQFLVGGGYHRETTVFPGDFADNKGSMHFNINSMSANQKFRVQLSGSYLQENNQLPNFDLTSYAMNLAPIAPALYTLDGNVNWETSPSGDVSTFIHNPAPQLINKFKNKTTNLIENMILSYRIIPGLDLKSSFGYSNLESNNVFSNLFGSFPPEYRNYAKRSSRFENSKISSWSIEPQLNYKRAFGMGKLDVLLGATIQRENRDASSINASGFNTDQVVEDIKSATLLTANSSINSVYKYNALFGRINYNWCDKYILNLTARRDGSSRFGSENQFHNFGAVGAAWIFSEEKFVKEKIGFLSFGKIRASYGTTGSDQIPDYRFLGLYDSYVVDKPYQGANGYLPTGLTNPYLQWEETRKLQIGLDFGFLKDRILLNTNFSLNRSSNQLLQYSLPLTTGFYSILTNFPATVQNTGLELAISTTNVSSVKFKWTSSINFTLPKNKLVSFVDFEKSSYAGQLIIGKSINIIKLIHLVGVDPNTGIYQFEANNGSVTSSPLGDVDNGIVINPDPKFYGGFQNSFIYKGFQLEFLFQFTKQVAKNYLFGSGYPAGAFNLGYNNQPLWQIDRWEKPGDIVSRAKYTTGYLSYVNGSDASWGDASYVRLKNVSVSWQLPKSWRTFGHLQNSKLYVQGQNLLTITSYKGLDPETKSSLTLPPLRMMTIGIQIGL